MNENTNPPRGARPGTSVPTPTAVSFWVLTLATCLAVLSATTDSTLVRLTTLPLAVVLIAVGGAGLSRARAIGAGDRVPAGPARTSPADAARLDELEPLRPDQAGGQDTGQAGGR